MRFLVPLEVEPVEKKRKRELLTDLRLYDAALDSLLADIGEERRNCGLGFYLQMPNTMKSPKMQALQSGLIQLGQWRNQTLAELAPLI
ncbi:MAG: hypothetical protein WBE13_13695 [Candidatus Acidiferrum sp.]